jgi:hypothetical protein
LRSSIMTRDAHLRIITPCRTCICRCSTTSVVWSQSGSVSLSRWTTRLAHS